VLAVEEKTRQDVQNGQAERNGHDVAAEAGHHLGEAGAHEGRPRPRPVLRHVHRLEHLHRPPYEKDGLAAHTNKHTQAYCTAQLSSTMREAIAPKKSK